MALENATRNEDFSPESPSANVGTSSAQYSSPEVSQLIPPGSTPSSESSGSAIVDTSPLSDSGYTEANSSTSSADSTQVQGKCSFESSPTGEDPAAVIKER